MPEASKTIEYFIIKGELRQVIHISESQCSPILRELMTVTFQKVYCELTEITHMK